MQLWIALIQAEIRGHVMKIVGYKALEIIKHRMYYLMFMGFVLHLKLLLIESQYVLYNLENYEIMIKQELLEFKSRHFEYSLFLLMDLSNWSTARQLYSCDNPKFPILGIYNLIIINIYCIAQTNSTIIQLIICNCR